MSRRLVSFFAYLLVFNIHSAYRLRNS